MPHNEGLSKLLYHFLNYKIIHMTNGPARTCNSVILPFLSPSLPFLTHFISLIMFIETMKLEHIAMAVKVLVEAMNNTDNKYINSYIGCSDIVAVCLGSSVHLVMRRKADNDMFSTLYPHPSDADKHMTLFCNISCFLIICFWSEQIHRHCQEESNRKGSYYQSWWSGRHCDVFLQNWSSK